MAAVPSQSSPVAVVIAVIQAKGLITKLGHSFVIRAKLDSKTLLTDPVPLNKTIRIDNELIICCYTAIDNEDAYFAKMIGSVYILWEAWMVDHKMLHHLRVQRTQIKLECLDVDDRTQAESLIGFVMVDLRGIQDHQVAKWHRLSNNQFAKAKPFIQLVTFLEVPHNAGKSNTTDNTSTKDCGPPITLLDQTTVAVGLSKQHQLTSLQTSVMTIESASIENLAPVLAAQGLMTFECILAVHILGIDVESVRFMAPRAGHISFPTSNKVNVRGTNSSVSKRFDKDTLRAVVINTSTFKPVITARVALVPCKMLLGQQAGRSVLTGSARFQDYTCRISITLTIKNPDVSVSANSARTDHRIDGIDSRPQKQQQHTDPELSQLEKIHNGQFYHMDDASLGRQSEVQVYQEKDEMRGICDQKEKIDIDAVQDIDRTGFMHTNNDSDGEFYENNNSSKSLINQYGKDTDKQSPDKSNTKPSSQISDAADNLSLAKQPHADSSAEYHATKIGTLDEHSHVFAHEDHRTTSEFSEQEDIAPKVLHHNSSSGVYKNVVYPKFRLSDDKENSINTELQTSKAGLQLNTKLQLPSSSQEKSASGQIPIPVSAGDHTELFQGKANGGKIAWNDGQQQPQSKGSRIPCNQQQSNSPPLHRKPVFGEDETYYQFMYEQDDATGASLSPSEGHLLLKEKENSNARDIQASLELELWMNQQKQSFQDSLEKEKKRLLDALAEEWRYKNDQREKIIAEKVRGYQQLEHELKVTLSSLEKREKELQQNEEDLRRRETKLEDDYHRKLIDLQDASRRLEQDFLHQTKLQSEHIRALEDQTAKDKEKMSQHEQENSRLRHELSLLQAQLNQGPNTRLEQECSVLKAQNTDLRQQINTLQSAKEKYKAQWSKSLQAIAKLKQKNELVAREQLRREHAELEHLRLQYLAHEERQISNQERMELEKLKAELRRLADLTTRTEESEQPRFQNERASVQPAANHSSSNDLRRLTQERDSLLASGIYQPHDTVILNLERQIHSIIKSNCDN